MGAGAFAFITPVSLSPAQRRASVRATGRSSRSCGTVPIHKKPRRRSPMPTAATEALMLPHLLDPFGNMPLTCFVALIPVVFLLVLLAVFRLPAWLASLLGWLVTFALAVWGWNMPFDAGSRAYLYGSATGIWN